MTEPDCKKTIRQYLEGSVILSSTELIFLHLKAKKYTNDKKHRLHESTTKNSR